VVGDASVTTMVDRGSSVVSGAGVESGSRPVVESVGSSTPSVVADTEIVLKASSVCVVTSGAEVVVAVDNPSVESVPGGLCVGVVLRGSSVVFASVVTGPSLDPDSPGVDMSLPSVVKGLSVVMGPGLVEVSSADEMVLVGPSVGVVFWGSPGEEADDVGRASVLSELAAVVFISSVDASVVPADVVVVEVVVGGASVTSLVD